ncbi:unnamed protein product [Nippostrongylus brasiliensis]|uniref:Axin-like protein pry-1 (inferred by orthology to a C. elegans protein) n=1 Tax=Nippostrongylus brasiliensis TaxID=27835 RepID=A0A0N4YW04_NIPBR|nr:unnamed protein product [Nippostrongylus brasiliensis]
MPSEWDRPHMRWTLRLEYVLSDRTALDAFREWLVANSSPQIGIRLKSVSSGLPDPRLFAPVLPYLDSFLRQQHEQFVCSEEFLEAFNRVNMGGDDTVEFPAERRRSGTSMKKPQLTAETLMKSRHDREHVLGER